MLYRLGVIDWFWSYLNCTWRISISISLYWWCSPGGQALLLAPLLLKLLKLDIKLKGMPGRLELKLAVMLLAQMWVNRLCSKQALPLSAPNRYLSYLNCRVYLLDGKLPLLLVSMPLLLKEYGISISI